MMLHRAQQSTQQQHAGCSGAHRGHAPVMGVEGLVWEKVDVESGMHYMSRAQYDMCNEQL